MTGSNQSGVSGGWAIILLCIIHPAGHRFPLKTPLLIRITTIRNSTLNIFVVGWFVNNASAIQKGENAVDVLEEYSSVFIHVVDLIRTVQFHQDTIHRTLHVQHALSIPVDGPTKHDRSMALKEQSEPDDDN